MRKNDFYHAGLTICLILILSFFNSRHSHAQTLCVNAGSEQIDGDKDGYRYELWNQNSQGTACMTLGSGALFKGEWTGVKNYLARRGLGYDQTRKHHEIGRFYANYHCNYNPFANSGGNSYLAIYGWTTNPLAEFYIVEDWRNWIPSMDPGATLKGSILLDGSVYDVYENTRVNQPSIVGNTTFLQYFSIRRDVRNGGTINISDHFDKWEELGMKMGDMYEVSFVVEGYDSSGKFEFTDLDISLEDNSVPGKKTENKMSGLSDSLSEK